LARADLGKAAVVVVCNTGAIDRTKRSTIEIRIRRTDIENARFKQRLLRRTRKLLIDKIRNAGGCRARHESFAEGFENVALLLCQRTKRDVLCARLTRRKQDLLAADSKSKRAQGRALHEGAPLDLGHYCLPRVVDFLSFAVLATLRARPAISRTTAKSNLKL